MKQTIYKITCCIVAAFIVLCSFAVPSFAESNNSIDFTNQPLPSSLDNAISYQGNYSIYCSRDDVYAFFLPYSNSKVKTCFISTSNDNATYYLVSNGSNAGTNNLVFSYYSDTYDLYYTGTSYMDNSNLACPLYSDAQSALADVRDYIDNGGGSAEPSLSGDYLLEIPKGTVAYIGVPSNGTLSMSGTKVMPTDSNLFGTPWPDDPTRVQVVSSRPSTGENIENVNSGAMPNWHKDDKYHNMWGQTDKASFGPSNWTFDDGPGFLKIYNPFYYGAAGSSNIGGGSFVDNNSLFVTISGYSSIRLYSVKDTIGSTGIVGSVDTPDQYWDKDLTDSNEDGVPDNNSWSASDPGMSSTPDNSQLNQPSAVESISGYLNTITSTLSKFANNIIDLIQAPISHIGQLIDAGSGFMSGLHGLYAWLPSDIQGYITSALSLVVCIGVFKVFL